jgi:hypothetical protein
MKNISGRIASIFLQYFNILFTIIVAGMYANALLFPNMGVDASYYLRVTECIADGAIPEHSLRILYPPLVFYMLLPVKLIVGKVIGYEAFLAYMFLVQLLNAFLIYKISGKYTSFGFIRVFAGLLYLFLSIKLEGEYLFLEPYINLWGLLAILAYLNKGKDSIAFLVLSGCFAFLSFLTKQYGLAYAGIIYVMILIDERSSLKALLKRGLVFSAGIIGGLLLFMVLFRLGYGVNYDFFAGGRLTFYGEKDTNAMLNSLTNYIKIAPYLIFLLVPAIFKKLFSKRIHFLAYLILALLFSLQLYFQQYDHYFILMIPGLILIGLMLFDLYYARYKLVLILSLLVSLFINEAFVGPKTSKLILSKRSSLPAEIALAREINRVLPEGSYVYLFGEVKFYYLCHFNAVIPEKYGYAYNNALYYSDFAEILDRAENLLIRKDHMEMEYPLLDKYIRISEEPGFRKFIKVDQVDQYLVFKRQTYIE